MEQGEQILAEIKELKSAIARIIGTADLSAKRQFSKTSLDKVANEFQKLNTERGEWIKDNDVHKIIRSAPYSPSKFLINELGFAKYFRRGHTFYFNKQDLISLGKEINARNVNLSRYIELKADQLKFQKYIESVPKSNKEGKPYSIPEDARDINTIPPKNPPIKVVKDEIKKLKEEFEQYKLSEYIDVYRDSHAMSKFIYYHNKYMDPEIKKRIKRWISDFNDANHFLNEIRKK
jgi:hypothetical protein